MEKELPIVTALLLGTLPAPAQLEVVNGDFGDPGRMKYLEAIRELFDPAPVGK